MQRRYGHNLLCVLVAVVLTAAWGHRAAAEQPGEANVVRVTNRGQLYGAIKHAKPGRRIVLAPGEYRGGGLFFINTRGTAEAPIVIEGEDPDDPPIIRGGSEGLHFSNAEHLTLRNIIIDGAADNGINIDDGSDFDTPARHITLERITVRNIGKGANNDGMKLSGIVGLRIIDCTVDTWGVRGSGIDFVGCHDVLVEGCTIRSRDDHGANGVQIKGGSTEVTVRACRFEHAGARAVQIGGSTGLSYFRPAFAGYEAKAVIIEGCTIIGGHAAIAFVSSDSSIVQFNTIYRPKHFIVRILQENRNEGFIPCRDGVFENNLVVWRSDELRTTFNIGPETDPMSFKFIGNGWHCLDQPTRSDPKPPTREVRGVYDAAPTFTDAEAGKLTQTATSPHRDRGADALTDDAR